MKLTKEQRDRILLANGDKPIDWSKWGIIIEFSNEPCISVTNFSEKYDTPYYGIGRLKFILRNKSCRKIFRPNYDGTYGYEDLGITKDKALEIIESLNESNFIESSIEDKHEPVDTYTKEVKIGSKFIKLYIKLRVNTKNQLYVVSFHEKYFGK